MNENRLARLYLVGTPGPMGGASTKLLHLVRLLATSFNITIATPDPRACKDKWVQNELRSRGSRCIHVKELKPERGSIVLGMCDADFFSSGLARRMKTCGAKVIWSNEMMWAFTGEADAAKEGVIDRVLFTSEFQAKEFLNLYNGVPSFITGNYIDAADYGWRVRTNPVFTIGRLSRPDPYKYPLDFPVFYEELGFKEVRYRVMAWSAELQKQYRWHRFGPEWELLPAKKETAVTFLYSLDLFLYPLGHRVKESWGRAVVEAMLTGAVVVAPVGHQFEKLIVQGETGFVCKEFREFRGIARELYENYECRLKVSRQAGEYARQELCNPQKHLDLWLRALTF